MIRLAEISDAKAVADIYNPYILNTVITFEEQTVNADEMASRMCDKIAQNRWLVYEEDGAVVGYAYAAPYASRSAWRYTVEVSVYMDSTCQGKGVGTALYKQLLSTLKEQGAHTVMALIALPNDKSEALHKKLGFEKVGQVTEGGYKFDRWIDVGHWQLIL